MTLEGFIKLIQLLIPIVGVASFVLLTFGCVQYFVTTGDELSRKEGKHKMYWGSATLIAVVFLWVISTLLAEKLLG